MNSQIYCLPQKFDSNEFSISKPCPKDKKLSTLKNFTHLETPYFKVDLNGTEISEQARASFIRHYPHFGEPAADAADKAKSYAYRSEAASSYRPIYIYPQGPKRPVTFEKDVTPLRHNKRRFNPPYRTLMPEGPGPHDDSQRGFYPWRGLVFSNNNYLWHALEKRDWSKETSERNTLPPIRLVNHDATREKERWDYVRNLARNHAISYDFRREVPGYTGFKSKVDAHLLSPVETDLAHPNPAMESTTQAVYREFPQENYLTQGIENENRHKGPLSRMVTLTHPFNPFTQQSAYCNVGASGTQ